MPASGEIFDGYELIRPIGQGGFGEVWLAVARSTGSPHALKFVRRDSGSALGKELAAVTRYREIVASIRSANIMPIEHVNRYDGGLFYAMPLADGVGASAAESPEWYPYTLSVFIEQGRAADSWHSSDDIKAVMLPILEGLRRLSEAGLVHRDIKPDNILFFPGTPCIGDVSLLTDDRTQITRHGTPGYSTPSWYIGGHHDMYGAAAVLYSLLTGNEPDRMGRVAFIWPPQGEASLNPEERKEWLRLHSVIRRATDEKPGERYVDFAAMAEALCGTREPAIVSNSKHLVRRWLQVVIPLLAVSAVAWIVYKKNAGKEVPHGDETARTTGAGQSDAYAGLIADYATMTDDHCRKLDSFMNTFQKDLNSVQTRIDESVAHPVDSTDFEHDLIFIRDHLKTLSESGMTGRSNIYDSAQKAEYKIIEIASGIPRNADE